MILGAIVIGALVTFLYLNRQAKKDEPAPVLEAPEPDRSVPVDPPPPVVEPIPAMQETEVDTPQSPLDALKNAGLGARKRNPVELMQEIVQALEAGDLEKAGSLIGSSALTPESRAKLAALASAGPLRFQHPDPAREVGEMEINARSRWALHLEGVEAGYDRLFFDLARKQGTWGVESMTLPPPPGQPAPKALHVDALGIADAFLQATFRQEFEMAKEFVDTSKISDAKIAGLCILFEEGKYRMRPQKPLRAMFQRDSDAGFLANVLAGDGSELAQFSMTLHQSESDKNWRVIEINLDQLLADYARRVAGGDVYYTPLLKNPKGGDTLVLYFDFDAAGLTPRTERQLEIVSDILRLDPDKQLKISGHTDALGTEDYNEKLSADRALSVRDFLIKCGVEPTQIVTVGQGQTQPRRPNFTETGEDNPEGRRANRRSEIYLDF